MCSECAEKIEGVLEELMNEFTMDKEIKRERWVEQVETGTGSLKD